MDIKNSEEMNSTFQDEKEQAIIENSLQEEITDEKRNVSQNARLEDLSAWEVVCLARHPKRPKADDYIEALFPDFIELHGDRFASDDTAMRGGIASFHGRSVTVLAQRKGRCLEDNLACNFGMLHPDGYRKAMRLAKQAERFHRPIITLVDTSGAYPGKQAEERGQAEAIASCLAMFSEIKTPVIVLVLSEGGSGGALAFSVGDYIMMLKHAMYSVLSPEGFASILWKDDSRVEEAAQVMELRAQDLFDKGIIDEIIMEPKEGIHDCFSYVIEQIDSSLQKQLSILEKKKIKTLIKERYKKIRKLGVEYVC